MSLSIRVWRRSCGVFFLGVLIAILSACGRGSAGPASSANGKVLRFRKLAVFDPAAGVNAFSLLIPEGWQSEGGIIWRPNLSNQAAALFRAWNPDGKEVLEILPCDPFTWRPGGIPFFGRGSIYLGNELQPPLMDPKEYVIQIAIPRYRQEITNPQVVSTTPLPDLAMAVVRARAEPGVRKQGQAARVRVAYTVDGVAMHEDFYCVLLMASGMAAMPGLSFWGPDSICSFRAKAGKLDETEGLSRTMIASVQMTPEWFNIFVQVQQMWIQNQMQSIRNAGRISDYISRTHQDISDTMMQAYQNRQASEDRISREFSEYIRGVETYNDPNRSNPVELPSGYENVWATPNGEYLLSESANFNPNQGDTRNWQRMEAVQ